MQGRVSWSSESDLNRRFYGFAIRCIGPLCHRYVIHLVREAGLEPASPKAADFKSAVYTVPPLPRLVPCDRIELPYLDYETSVIPLYEQGIDVLVGRRRFELRSHRLRAGASPSKFATYVILLVLSVRLELTLSATSTLCVYQLRHESRCIDVLPLNYAPRKRSPLVCQRPSIQTWWILLGSNQRPSPCQGDDLPLI
jgi:hypothetical protein